MSGASEIVKIVVGILLMLGGIAWYFVKIPLLGSVLAAGSLVPFWRSFLVVFAGFFGLLVLLVGLVLAWLSYDEYKTSRETSETS
jgi:hypothetical protein